MLKKLQKRNSEGFTIIEVMIVLAIAALILLIVLLAVPALQRSSRNTQRKNDVSALASAVGDFTNNNNGKGPSSTADIQGSGNPPTGGLISNVKLGYYNPGDVWYATAPVTNVSAAGGQGGNGNASTLTSEDVIVVKGAVCDNNNTPTTTGASSRSYAIEYAIESKSSANGQIQCVEAG